MSTNHLLILLYLAPIAFAILGFMSWQTRRDRRNRELLEESQRIGLSEPPSLHPVVDPTRCIGSGTCVDACPEHALGLIGGKAVLVNPSACIGHGACHATCPFDAIQLVFGTERRGVDIPLVKPTFETNVRGIFIAGELGGMGLIRKAAEQGRQAMDAIAADRRRAKDADVVIIGAGPAGIAAGLAAIQHRVRYILIEQEDSLGGSVLHYPRNKIAMTHPVELPIVGPMHFVEVSKEKLLAFWLGIVGRTQLQIRFGHQMTAIETLADNRFRVVTPRGSFETGAVLLSIGRRGTPRQLGVPGEQLDKVMYRLLDPEQYCGRDMLVVGGGDSAVEAALACATAGARVTLSYRGDAFNRVKRKNRERLEAAVAQQALSLRLRSEVAAIHPERVTLSGDGATKDIPNDFVVVCAGGVLPMDLLRAIGIQFETKFGTA